nr:hypothetical protein [Prevotella scopos]
MDTKLDNFSEISKLLSVKSKMSSDILSLFSKFGLGRMLCRLSLEKHDGISAVQLILSLCLFRINGETIHSIYKKNFYHLLTTGKNCYYRMMVRQTRNWRRLLSYTVLRFECILRRMAFRQRARTPVSYLTIQPWKRLVESLSISPRFSTMYE